MEPETKHGMNGMINLAKRVLGFLGNRYAVRAPEWGPGMWKTVEMVDQVPWRTDEVAPVDQVPERAGPSALVGRPAAPLPLREAETEHDYERD